MHYKRPSIELISSVWISPSSHWQPSGYSMKKIRVQNSSEQQGVQDRFHLGNGVCIQAVLFKGRHMIDIRLWLQNQNGEWRPTRRGIRLLPTTWVKLLETNEPLAADISKVIMCRIVNKFYTLGDDTYASIASPLWKIDIRLWHLGADGVLRVRRKGITLNFSQWRKLLELNHRITHARPCLKL